MVPNDVVKANNLRPRTHPQGQEKGLDLRGQGHAVFKKTARAEIKIRVRCTSNSLTG